MIAGGQLTPDSATGRPARVPRALIHVKVLRADVLRLMARGRQPRAHCALTYRSVGAISFSVIATVRTHRVRLLQECQRGKDSVMRARDCVQ